MAATVIKSKFVARINCVTVRQETTSHSATTHTSCRYQTAQETVFETIQHTPIPTRRQSGAKSKPRTIVPTEFLSKREMKPKRFC